MPYPFGKDITYTFYAISERDAIDLSSVTAAPAIYVYKESYKPSRSEAAAGTDNGGIVGVAITTWTDTDDGEGKQFTIPAIDDPDVTSTEEERTYWLAINFYLQDSEQLQTVVRALPLHRIYAHHKAVTTSEADLEAIYSDIDSVKSSAEQTAAIAAAKTRAQIDLEAQGFEWAELWRPDRLSTAIAYKALEMLMFSLMTDQGDAWNQLGVEYRSVYKATIGTLKAEYIVNQDDDPADYKPAKIGGVMRVVR